MSLPAARALLMYFLSALLVNKLVGQLSILECAVWACLLLYALLHLSQPQCLFVTIHISIQNHLRGTTAASRKSSIVCCPCR